MTTTPHRQQLFEFGQSPVPPHGLHPRRPAGDRHAPGRSPRHIDRQLTPAEQQRLTAIRRQREADDREQEAVERASYQVVALDRLPSITDLGDADRAGGADWPVIAAAAIDMFEAGIDPLSTDQVLERSADYGLGADDRRWLVSLFCDPVIAVPDSARYTNGRHRTAAMRAQGVQRCVVHTNAGYRDSGEPGSSL